MSAAITATPQVEADKRLIEFETYEDYLNSLVNNYDHCFLQSNDVARTIAELGYRSSGETLTRDQFQKRLAAVIEYLYPTFKPYVLASEQLQMEDHFLMELSIRERPNRMGVLATIVYVRHFTKTGFEISGYIDYSERLETEDWKPIFRGQKKVVPRTSDLGYYHWRSDRSTCNDSKNYKTIIDPRKGLQFQNRYDRKLIAVDPAVCPGSNTVRIRVHSTLYEDAVIYDHVVMQRI